jgi:hypothetical protein
MKNPNVEVGDRIMCLHMDNEVSVPPGTIGTVTKVQADPTMEDTIMISVKWDNGSSLSLLSDVDAWKKVKENVSEGAKESFFEKNEDLFDFFDRKWFNQFLMKMRDTGIVNMLTAAPLIYSGKEHLDRYYGEGKEDDEDFQELLEMADTARDKMIQGIMEYIEAKNLEIDEDMRLVNSLARKFSVALVGNYILFNNFRQD